MTNACSYCEQGPANANGHDKLFAESFHGGHLVLKCRECGSFWIREAATDGSYRWTRTATSQGALTP